VSETQPPVRVIKTRGRGHEALVEIDGRQLVVTDAFSPIGDASARDVPLSRARLFGTVDEGREAIGDVVRVNPDQITRVVQRGANLWLAHGRIEEVGPIEMNCGSVRLTLWNVPDDDPTWLHHFMTAPLNRLELTGRLGAEDEQGHLLLAELPALDADVALEPGVRPPLSLAPEVEREPSVAQERATNHPTDPPFGSEPPDDIGFDVHKHFTMGQLLMLMTAATIVLGVLRLLPASVGTFLVGFVVLVGMLFATDQRTAPAIVRLAWWMLLGIYLISATVTMRGMP
jgi:hypothetical protein